jgi:hypothetical protein
MSNSAGKEVMTMGDTVISVYTLEEALADGVLVRVCEPAWPKLTGGKPIVASAAVYQSFSLSTLLEIWDQYVYWYKQVMPHLPEEERLFATMVDEQKVWVLDDPQAVTILFPDDY